MIVEPMSVQQRVATYFVGCVCTGLGTGLIGARVSFRVDAGLGIGVGAAVFGIGFILSNAFYILAFHG